MEKTLLRPVIDQIATGEKIKKIRKEQGLSVRDIQNILDSIIPRQFMPGSRVEMFLP